MRPWRNCKLGDLIQIKHGFAFRGEHFSHAGTHIVVTPGNFYDEGGFKTKGAKEKWYTGPVPLDYVLSEGDLIVAMTEQAEGLLGSCAVIPSSHLYLHNQRLGRVELLDVTEIDKRFIYYVFNSQPIRQQIRASATGTKVRHTAPSRIEDVTVMLPSLPEQRRIGSILSAYDNLINNIQQRIRILEEMARALYREWFVHFRFPGNETHPLVSSAQGEIPQGWEVKTVEAIVHRIAVGKKYDQKTVKPIGAVPVLDQGKSGVIGYHDSEPGVVASELAPVVVFANHTCYQRLIHFPFSAIQNVLPFVPNSSLPRDIYWLHWATKGLVVFNDYKGHWPEFAAKTVVVPSIDVCEEFGLLVSPLSRGILHLERTAENLRRTRDLLLPRLLSGNINVDAA